MGNQTTGQADRRAAVGAKIEQRMAEKYGLIHDHPGRADAQYSNGTPVEIKSAQRRKKDGRGGTKPGEFYIFETSHRWLRRRDGYYIFVVYRFRGTGVEVLDARRVHASNLPRLTLHESGHTGRNNDREARLKVGDIF